MTTIAKKKYSGYLMIAIGFGLILLSMNLLTVFKFFYPFFYEPVPVTVYLDHCETNCQIQGMQMEPPFDGYLHLKDEKATYQISPDNILTLEYPLEKAKK